MKLVRFFVTIISVLLTIFSDEKIDDKDKTRTAISEPIKFAEWIATTIATIWNYCHTTWWDHSYWDICYNFFKFIRIIRLGLIWFRFVWICLNRFLFKLIGAINYCWDVEQFLVFYPKWTGSEPEIQSGTADNFIWTKHNYHTCHWNHQPNVEIHCEVALCSWLYQSGNESFLSIRFRQIKI